MPQAVDRVRAIALGFTGGVLGGTVGYAAFFWIARQGFLALAIPGALLGLGCGLLSGRRSWALGIVCGVAALALGVACEWQRAPFVRDESFGFFIRHLADLPTITQLMLAAGTLLGFWLGLGREGTSSRRSPPQPDNRAEVE